MKRLLSTFCFAALAAAAGTVAFPDAVTLDNGHIRVGVSPAAGRIVDFAPSGGGNLLWLNTGAEVREQRGSGRWVNYGGDRLWPELYNYWRSIRRVNIPDPQIDGGGWVLVERAPLALTIRSRVSESLGCRALRRIELVPGRPRLAVTNRLEQVEPTPARVPYRISSDEQGGITVLPEQLVYRAPRGTTTKLTGNGEWLAARFGELLLVQASRHAPGACYPEGGSQLLFTGPRYAELEFCGGLRHLKPGEAVENTVYWELVRLPRDAGETGAARVTRTTAHNLLQGKTQP